MGTITWCTHFSSSFLCFRKEGAAQMAISQKRLTWGKTPTRLAFRRCPYVHIEKNTAV